MNSLYLSEIWIYPVKSLAGFRVPQARACWAGLEHDRQWMVVDASGSFLTQREIPRMALLQVCTGKEGLLLSATDQPGHQLAVPISGECGPLMQVKVWDDTVMAHMPSIEANRWLSARLDQEVSLVRMYSVMPNKTEHVKDQVPTRLSFADDFPYHLISRSSLDDLNLRLDEKIDIRRFRPNFVISGMPAYMDDELGTMTIGSAKFVSVSQCERCVVVNIDPQSGEKSRQPLKTLASFRRRVSKINFGQNVIAVQEGIVAEGDPVLLSI